MDYTFQGPSFPELKASTSGEETQTQNPTNVKSLLTLCCTLFELERSEKEETALYRELKIFNSGHMMVH